MKKYITLFIVFACSAFIMAESTYDMARKAYEKGSDGLARTFFDDILRTDPFNEHAPDALYFISRICDRQGDFADFVYYTTRLLNEHRHDARCGDIFDTLLVRLIEKESYVVANNFIEQFDYLPVNDHTLQTIGIGLIKQNHSSSAEAVLSLCPQTDTVIIIRASIAEDDSTKMHLYESMESTKGKIYLLEFLLESGDTISAYETYRRLDASRIDDDVIVRYARISMLFHNNRFRQAIERLKPVSEYGNTVSLLEAIHSGCALSLKPPRNEVECALLAEYLEMDTISCSPPESVDVTSGINDSLSVVLKEYRGKNFFVDSMYADMLVDSGRTEEAHRIIAPYEQYSNVRIYVRKINSLYHYKKGLFEEAAHDVILTRSTNTGLLYVLARSLTHLGRNADYLYKDVLSRTQDTILAASAARQLAMIRFEQGQYGDVAAFDIKMFREDTHTVRLYCYSLARTGKRKMADSIFTAVFGGPDRNLHNYYGEYLISCKHYSKARLYYDSVQTVTNNKLTSTFYYNWALVPFLQGKMDTAQSRLKWFVKTSAKGKDYYRALFKIATAHYLDNEFDTAAYYYGLSSADDSLRVDALQNQLICYKKGAEWLKAIDVGMELLNHISTEEINEVNFEIGYAHLRLGRTKGAVQYIGKAADAEPSPEYYFWLGEAYLAKADFVRALYQYKNIVETFPRDEMWTPTAEFKVGIVLEFMDEIDAAKDVYTSMIKKRGAGDTWAIEAQRRLDELK